MTFSLMLSTWLGKKGFKVQSVTEVAAAREAIRKNTFQLVLSDLRLPDGDGIGLLKWAKEQTVATPFIMMTSYADIQTAVQAMKLGASDYIAKPLNPEELLVKIQELTQPSSASRPVKTSKPVDASPASSGNYVTGVSKGALQVYEHARLVAPTDMSVLITGSSGTGKEYVARYLHEHSERRNAPFVPVDCGAIPKDLAASEFFGHIKGSFTGAIDNKTGAFVAAQGGTIFLDEIGNLTYEVQVQLLRALQERKVKPVGSNQEVPINVRLISATNENLRDAIGKGDFREDLYHRINEFTIRIPDLRDRKEDIMLFATNFLAQANRELNKQIAGFDLETIRLFESYAWPGNLRQMKNVVRYATLLASGTHITQRELPEELSLPVPAATSPIALKDEDHERDLIRKALKEADNNKTKAAQLLGIDRKTLYNKMRLYQLD